MTVKAYAAKAAKGTLERYDYEAGPLGADDVEIRVTHFGIFHSDISMIDNHGGLSQYPLVPDHEAIGIITAVGANVDGIRQTGQRVGVGLQAGSCGHGRFTIAYVSRVCGQRLSQHHLCPVRLA